MFKTFRILTNGSRQRRGPASCECFQHPSTHQPRTHRPHTAPSTHHLPPVLLCCPPGSASLHPLLASHLCLFSSLPPQAVVSITGTCEVKDENIFNVICAPFSVAIFVHFFVLDFLHTPYKSPFTDLPCMTSVTLCMLSA